MTETVKKTPLVFDSSNVDSFDEKVKEVKWKIHKDKYGVSLRPDPSIYFEVPSDVSKAQEFMMNSAKNWPSREIYEGMTDPWSLSQICGGCLKWNSGDCHFNMCGKCKLAHYCSVECQKQDWPEHKKKCVVGETNGMREVKN